MRWTSPASSATRRPWSSARRPAARTRPRPGRIPPLALGHPTMADRGRRADPRRRAAPRRLPPATARARGGRRPGSAGSPRPRGPTRPGLIAQLGRQVARPHGDVDADPQHRPPLLRATLRQDAGDLPPVGRDHVVRPSDLRVPTDDLGHREARGQRHQPAGIPEHQAHHEGPAPRRRPRPSLAAPPRRLVVRRDQGSVGRPAGRKLPGTVVGRRRQPVVDPRQAEPALRQCAGGSRSPARCPAARPPTRGSRRPPAAAGRPRRPAANPSARRRTPRRSSPAR